MEKGDQKYRPRAGGVAQVIEHLPSKCETLCSSPDSTKKKKNLKKKYDGKSTGLESELGSRAI
jgi:hypothetical protein